MATIRPPVKHFFPERRVRPKARAQGGFTIIEMLSVVVLFGLFISVVAPMFANSRAAESREYREKNKLANRLIGEGLEAYATTQPSKGMLPAPYTGGGFVATVFNAGDTSAAGVQLTQALTNTRVTPMEINSDGTAGSNVRVYQLLSGLTTAAPFEMQSGALVTLTYQFGVIYLTQCQKADASCNPGPSGIPGSSPVLTAANYKNYQLSGDDLALITVSSLPRQRSMLETTRNRLNDLQDALLSDFRAKQIIAAAGDATNFYPAATSSMSGLNPGTNQGCRDGWYSLASSDVLAQVQISSIQYGKTEWGGAVEFCRDYDPLGSKTPDAPPHKAALRINANVSLGIAPDPSVPGNNIFLTF